MDYILILMIIVLSVVSYHLYNKNQQLVEKSKLADCIKENPENIKVEDAASSDPAQADLMTLDQDREGNHSEKYPEMHDSDMNLMLIVEDSDESREFIKESFSSTFRILEAANGKEGLELAMQYIPDIIVSDVVMPEMDGNTLCNKVKNAISTCHIPFILLTARSSVDHKKEGYDVGADAYVTKPFSAGLLESRINNLLKSRLQLKAHYTRTFLLQLPEISTASSDEYFLNQLVTVIEKFAGEPDFDVNKLALEFNFSRAVLYRKVKALTNLSLIELIRRVRLKKAAQLLSSKQYRVSEVAFLVGFNDLKHFRSCFKEQYHMSPSELLKGDKELKSIL